MSKNGRGGAPEGAGRPLGARTVRTQEAAIKLKADGEPLPLEIIVKTAREYWKRAQALPGEKDGKVNERRLEMMSQASDHAAKAAPYMHPRLAAVMVKDMQEEEKATDAPVDTVQLARKIALVLSRASLEITEEVT